MTAKISKWGNSAAVRLPKEIMEFVSLHIGDKINIEYKNDSVVITHIDNKKDLLIAEAKRIKKHATNEYNNLEGSLDDGL